MNERALAARVDDLVRICRDVFGGLRLEAIVQHGSSVKGGAIPGYSDIDFQIYLSPDCFDDNAHLTDDLTLDFQDAFGPLRWEETGFGYAQVYFYDRHRLPAWWTGPPPRIYREIVGKLPAEAQATSDKMRRSSVRLLKELPRYISSDLDGYVDTSERQLPRRLRLLGTSLTPTLFALLSHDAENTLDIWAQSKFEAVDRLEARYRGEGEARLARQFYAEMTALFAGVFEPQRARDTFKLGVQFLRWAATIGYQLPDPGVESTPGRTAV